MIGDISRHIEIEPVMTPPEAQPNTVRIATAACQTLNEDTGSPTDLQLETARSQSARARASPEQTAPLIALT